MYYMFEPRVFIPLRSWLEPIQLQVKKMEIKTKVPIYDLPISSVKNLDTFYALGHEAEIKVWS